MLLGALLVVIACVLLGARSYLGEQRQFFPVQQAVRLPAQASGIAGALDVSFESPAGTLRGWYVPSHNHAAVILTHGAGANRAQLTAERHARWSPPASGCCSSIGRVTAKARAASTGTRLSAKA